MLSIKERFNIYTGVLDKISTLNLISEEDILLYVIFEDLEMDVISQFYETSLEDLMTAGFIDKEQFLESKLVRELFLNLTLNGINWTKDAICDSEEWKNLIEKAKQLKMTF